MTTFTVRRAAGGRRADLAARRAIAATGRRALARLYRCVAEWYRRTRSRAQLARLPRAMLLDIGITAGDRERECTKPFWRP